MDDINTEEFINEIEMRPAVWNTKCETYNNRLEKKSAWEGICEKFIDDFKNKNASDQSLTASLLQKKWRHIRDSYSRELSKQRKLKRDSAGKNHRKYMYFNQLKFLSQLYERQNDQDLSDSTEGATPLTSTETKHVNDETNKILKLLAERMQRNADTFEDGDRYFLLSLLNDFKKIPENRKMDAKYDIIGVIRKYAVSDVVDNFDNSQYEQSVSFTKQSPESQRQDCQIEFHSMSHEIQKHSPQSFTENSSSDDNLG